MRNDETLKQFIKTVGEMPPVPDRTTMPGYVTVPGLPVLIRVDKSDACRTFWVCVPKGSFKHLNMGEVLEVMEVVDKVKERLKELRPDWTVL